MTDYVIKFSGLDNLSSTLNNIKSEIKDVGKSTTALEDISKKFQRILNSSAPLKKLLRDLKAIMADMNMKGLAGTDQYTKIALEAGRIKDAMDDAAAATKRFSDDTFALTATGDAMLVIAGAGSVAAGAMSMFGVESDKVLQAILKCQLALAVLNGVQAVANKLNKDSALMQALKTIRINLATAATVTNTTATVANTAATQAWNTAKAIGKALLGDWTGLLLVGGAALAAYALTTNNAADALEDLNLENKEGTSIERDAVKSASDKIAKLRTLYSITQDHTRSLKERNAAADEMRGMNPDILKGLTNEAILAGDAADAYNEMATAIIRVAEAEAAYERIKKLTAKKLELKQQDREFNSGIDKLSQGRKDAAALYGINLLTTAANYVNPEIAKLDDEINAITTEYSEGITKLLTGKSKKSGNGSPRTGGGWSGGGTTALPDPAVEGSLRWYNELISDMRKQLAELPIGSEGYINLKKQLDDMEIELNFIVNHDKIAKEIKEAYPKDAFELLNAKRLMPTEDLKGVEGIKTYNDLVKEAKERTIEMASVVSDSFLSIGRSIGGVAGDAVNIAGMLGLAVVTMIQGYAVATAQAAKLGPWAWVAFGLTGLAQLAAMVGAVKSMGAFAEGGIVGGSSMVGDRLVARVNSGEMILNGRQLRNLFNLLDNGGGIAGTGGLVEFKISGSTLKGVLRNYDNKMSKIR